MPTLQPDDPTAYSFSEVLQHTLKSLIVQYAVPAMNADFAARMAVKAKDPATAVHFGPADVVTGEKNPVKDPTICVLEPQDVTTIIATGTFETALVSQIYIKTGLAADNFPEDFANFNSVVADTLRDLFTSKNMLVLKPAGLLPGDLAYAQCHWMGSHRLNFPNKEADWTTYTRGLVAYHYAEISYGLDRPQALGSRG